MSSDNDDLIILVDENGKEIEAELIDSVEYRGNDYVILLPKESLGHTHGGVEDSGEGGGIGNGGRNIGVGKGGRDSIGAGTGEDTGDGSDSGDDGVCGGGGGAGGDGEFGCGFDCDCEEEVVILKIEQGVDGEEDALVSIEDEDEQEAVFELFKQRMEEIDYDDDGDLDEDDPEN